jgi:predicted phage-related endonuclease
MEYPATRAQWLALRHKHISSTEASALFGLSPYTTAFELAVQKKQPSHDGEFGTFESNERSEWGLLQQRAIAARIAKVYGVKARAINGYAVHSLTHTRMGASFDYEIIGVIEFPEPATDPILRDMYLKHGAGILEVKNVDWLVFRDQWPEADDGTREAPAHIEIQVQHQLACIGRFWAAVGVLVGGNKLELLVRERDDAVNAAIALKCAKFWDDLGKGVMPPIELPADAGIIAKLYRYSTPEKILDVQADEDEKITALCTEYRAAADVVKGGEDRKKTAKAQLLLLIGDAERVLAKGFTISATSIADTEVAAFTRSGYRNVRITAQKPKKEKGNGSVVQG